ncbi:MraY family glycosyltransferase [Chitinophaga vietnamensis]|uniref:MraY family glycosyltransferase n=1 Tax=Chitinophaga vietnamensis TaxID=2593957 RepID=UPI0011782144|nr:glycosyltransferase family 4 protein [Chitinophaga vietnamensis]
MLYLIITLILFAGLQVYFRLADRYNIIDKPNQRSSHTEITIRGGGIVFPLSALLYGIFFHQVSIYIIIAILLISLISLIDDIRSLSNKVRLLVHLSAVLLVLYGLGALQHWPLWMIAASCVLIIGVINAYNFMDGINGITGVYSLVALLSLWYTTVFVYPFTDVNFLICPAIASIIFLYYNFRKKARCFAGDVGSVSLGCWIATLILMLVWQSGDVKYLLFLAVYGVDTVLTILHRLLLGQNIFEAHRLHFYQILANERKTPHRWISVGYGLLQLFINLLVIYAGWNTVVTFVVICLPLAIIYAGMKNRLMTKTVAL